MARNKNELIAQMSEIELRWMTFLSKLEERMQELCEASIPELKEIYKQDKDEYKRSYGNFLSGIKGQLRGLEHKANEVADKNVNDPLEDIEEIVEDIADEELSDFFCDLKERCSDGHEKFESRVEYWVEKLESTNIPDYEEVYQSILDEYDQIKDKFVCKQCGSPITIEKLFFMPTFITCPACQTQNTFQPSSLASSLDDVGRLLAEQRTAHILKAYEDENDRERDLYGQMHKLEIEKIGYEISKNNEKLSELDTRISELDKQRRECERKAPEIYAQYLKAKFDEWVILVPELAEQNRKIYEQWVKRGAR